MFVCGALCSLSRPVIHGPSSFDYFCSDADNDSDGDLFADSDDDEPSKKEPAKPMSKREKMEALRAKKLGDQGVTESVKKRPKGDGAAVDKLPGGNGDKKPDGYVSGDSYNSENYTRTKEDDDFIDKDDDDEDALNELYREQHFDDERPLGSDEEDNARKKKKNRYGPSGSRKKGPDHLSDTEGEPDNPIMAAVNKMKRKKKIPKKLTELEDEAREFISKMENAADDDVQAVKARRPAVKKLRMLGDVTEMLTKRDMQRSLLDHDILSSVKRWIQPLPNGSLGNVTVRQRLIESIGNMSGENGITSSDLKRSGIGQTIMILYKHRSETPNMKRALKKLIEQWSRPIFQKSGNMKDLEHVHASRGQGMVRQVAASRPANMKKGPGRDQDIGSLIASGSKGGNKDGIARVRVPFSKGFQFTVRPQDRIGNVSDKRMVRGGPAKDNRGNLAKRMTEKGRVQGKNSRSANVSVEGRQTK